MLIQKPCFSNKELLDSYMAYNEYYGCEFSAANNILWSEYYETCFTIIEDNLVFCKVENNIPVQMTFPIGKGDKKKAFDAIVSHFKNNNLPFYMYMVEREMFQLIDEWYPGKYQIKYDRDVADYLYEWDTLAYLKGKKLHGKRNHINRFLENYPDYLYEKINESNFEECIKLAEDWDRTNNPDEKELSYETNILTLALKHRDTLGLNGALIRVDDRVVAFTLGESLTKDVYVVHFEKAYADVQGAYPMINREFVRRELRNFKYINREEDMGIPGLRHAKTSYQPIKLIDKGVVTRV
ncbi:MAG: DUF2156 domain-containing protein [Lachnospiraceae bacterium]|nr:DUF2156 domain-containing protein [Lachnospiraceae bacterium]